jgi:hypothetical protein
MSHGARHSSWIGGRVDGSLPVAVFCHRRNEPLRRGRDAVRVGHDQRGVVLVERHAGFFEQRSSSAEAQHRLAVTILIAGAALPAASIRGDATCAPSCASPPYSSGLFELAGKAAANSLVAASLAAATSRVFAAAAPRRAPLTVDFADALAGDNLDEPEEEFRDIVGLRNPMWGCGRSVACLCFASVS